jgi:hypothetical protein
MKKLFILFFALIVAIGATAQKGVLKTLTTTQLNGATTVYFTPIQLTASYQSLSVQLKFTQTGGTSDGYVGLLASNDGTNYFNINASQTALIYGSPHARVADSTLCTLAIVNGATVNWIIPDAPWKYYKIYATGTSGDSTSIAGNYVYK